MIIFKPEWITHSDRGSDSKGKKPCIYSIHVHPDGSRLATGSLDGKVKIWNTKPVYDEHSELDPNCHKLLSTMTMHNGAVLCVRWSNGEGRYLASGSDNDNVIIIWEQDRHASNASIFGSNDINYETWRAYKYLRGHESDVQDLAWSRDNQYLASCGVDGHVIVWDGATFEQVKKISQHAGFVKGVTWDPAGKFLATQSDDKMVKIWRTSDWGLEADIISPFINAPGTTLFRRLSWSPDGISLAAANAVNGLECIAAIINREDWNADVSLVGHKLPIEVTAFNPKMFYETSFQVDDDEDETDEKVMQAICALGSQDRGISIWITKYSRPICVAADVFNNNVYDLAWTPDGRGLFACSHDGTVVCILLNEELLEEVPEEQVMKELTKYGYGRKQTRLPETPAQLQLEEEAIILSKASKRIVAIMDGTSGSSNSINNSISNIPANIVSSTSTASTITEQKVTIGKDGKKRIQPIMLTTSVTPTQLTIQSSSQNLLPQSRMEIQELDNASNAMDIDIPSLPKSGVPSCVDRNKTKSDTFDHLDIRVDGIQFLKGKTDWIDSIVAPPIIQKSQSRAALPKVKSHFIVKSNPDDPTTILECHNTKLNSNKQNQLLNIGAKLAASREGKTIWLDYLSSAILLMTGNTYFSAVACEDGSIHVYTPAGARYLPPIVMSSTPVVLNCSNQWLLCLTATGLLYTWDVINMQPTLSAVSVAPILQVATALDSTHEASTVTDIRLLKDGIPMILTSLHQAFIFHMDMNVWLRISDAWYIISHFWESSDQNPLGWISRLTASPEEADPYSSILLDVGKNDPNAKESITVSHMETQLAVHALIGSRDQYLDCIREYATKLSMENEITKAEELCRWLIGPPVLSLECTEWNPAIMATLTKNEVLNQILPELAKNRQMEGFVNAFTPFT